MGIVSIVLGFIQYISFQEFEFVATGSYWLMIIFVLIGIITIVVSFFLTPKFKIHVVGREPLTISGKLEGIIKIIRQYREKVETEFVGKE